MNWGIFSPNLLLGQTDFVPFVLVPTGIRKFTIIVQPRHLLSEMFIHIRGRVSDGEDNDQCLEGT